MPPTLPSWAVRSWEAKAFSLHTSPRMLCSSGLEFSEIINMLLDKLSIDIDHMSLLLVYTLLLIYCPALVLMLLEMCCFRFNL